MTEMRFNNSVYRVTEIVTTETGEVISVTLYRKKRKKKQRSKLGLCGMKMMKPRRCC